MLVVINFSAPKNIFLADNNLAVNTNNAVNANNCVTVIKMEGINTEMEGINSAVLLLPFLS